MCGPLSDVSFLAASENRVRVLEALAADAHTRSELVDVSDSSRPTVSRILSAFEDRGWITDRDGLYEATALGVIVAAAFADLETAVETAQHLHDVLPYLPVDTMEFDLRHLRDATIVRQSSGDPLAPIRYGMDVIRSSSTAYGVSRALMPEMVNVGADTVEREGLDISIVADVRAFKPPDQAGDGGYRDAIRRFATDDRIDVYAHADVPHIVGVLDDDVVILATDDRGVVYATVVSDDPLVREWADGLYERYRADAVPVDAGTDLDALATQV
jgi:predicted transcriptional regulator